jgi:hypothetical protein
VHPEDQAGVTHIVKARESRLSTELFEDQPVSIADTQTNIDYCNESSILSMAMRDTRLKLLLKFS